MGWFSNNLEDGYERTRYRCNSDGRMFAACTCIRGYLYDIAHEPERHSCLSGASQSTVSEYPTRAVWSCQRLWFGILGHQQVPVCLYKPRKASTNPDTDPSGASSCVPGYLRIHMGCAIRDAAGRLSARMCAKPAVCRFRAMSPMIPE